VARCSKCNKKAITFIRYNGTHLCKDHFIEYVEKRVKAEVRKQIDLDRVKHVSVALSGGKDSTVALSTLKNILHVRKDITLSAITVDEGIDGYRPLTLSRAKELTKSLEVPHFIVSFRNEFGIDMDGIAKSVKKRTPCSYCGVLRRRCINRIAKQEGVDVIATGLNLDDTAQSILMNFTRGDIERLARLGPHVKIQPGLVPRIQPLRSIPEKENYLYALLKELPFSDDECPYAERALRNEYREIINKLEDRSPGTRHAILSSYDAILPALRDLFPPASMKECRCGEPTINGKCMTCELLEEIRKEMT
jgi:uncharacterized protein (TIGR00269 family)